MAGSVKVLESKIDKSVNFITPSGDGGFFESRYVRRSNEYFICYLSSHSGCNKGCAFCHLTATKQTMMKEATIPDFVNQAQRVFTHYALQPEAKEVNFNWMARGEPLDNEELFSNTLLKLNKLALEHELIPKFNISTIMPRTFTHNLAGRFSPIYPTIYYSLYSFDENFRKKWLPGAMHPGVALDILKEYQDTTAKIVYIHGCFIEGENDSFFSIRKMCTEILKRNLLVKFNIVRYNPPNNSDSKESPNLERIVHQLSKAFGTANVKIVPRVGSDVYASCGTFIAAEEY